MDAAQAISLVVERIRARGLDYPTEGLQADRFEAGWSVYAPVDVDESDPMAFLDMPVGRSVFLVGDSGRIEESSSSVPPQQAHDRFAAEERARQHGGPGESGEALFMAEFERGFREAEAEGPPVISSFTTAPPEDETAAEAAELIESIAQQLGRLGPYAWDLFVAEFSFTVSAEIARLRFWADGGSGLVSVPNAIAEMVRHQREIAAEMPAGPWWRLQLTVTDLGEMTVDYDYGDEPFPDDQLLQPEHYRDDLQAFPREYVPVWLAAYAAGPAAQGRDPHQAAVGAASGRTPVATDDLPPLHDLWARWAVLSATYAGVRSEWGPRIHPGYAWYENDHRSGSTLYLLPGERAVLSGGKWDSALLEAAYNRNESLPALYAGAPAWVTDAVLNTRNRNGLLSFCYWWVNGRWYRGATDTSGELDAPLPPLRTPDETIRAMAGQAGPGTEGRCGSLLTAATGQNATAEDMAAIFVRPGADLDTATNQLSLAGLLAAHLPPR